MNKHMLLYSASITSRIQYSADFIGQELQVDPFGITPSQEEFNIYAGWKIYYSDKRIKEQSMDET
jgi:hypothetical protein